MRPQFAQRCFDAQFRQKLGDDEPAAVLAFRYGAHRGRSRLSLVRWRVDRRGHKQQLLIRGRDVTLATWREQRLLQQHQLLLSARQRFVLCGDRGLLLGQGRLLLSD